MGCGKSSVGRRLSELLCCPFTDLDDAIAERAGRSIPDIFATEGEPYFRNLERETLADIIRSHSSDDSSARLILALGGGAVMTQACEQMVHEETLCIYLKASADTLISHLEGQAAGRPLLNTAAMPSASVISNESPSVMSSEQPSVMSSEVEISPLRKRILDLMSLRAETYERTAHRIIDTDGHSIDDIAAEIIRLIA